jgi:bacterioferritin
VASDLIGLLEQNVQLERSLIDHYDEASRFCQLIGDSENGPFFTALLEEEQQHGEGLSSWLNSLGGPRQGSGYGAYSQRHNHALQRRRPGPAASRLPPSTPIAMGLCRGAWGRELVIT